VIVAVISMGMVQVVSNQVVNVIPVRNGLMRAVWTMDMSLIMSSTRMVGRASVGIGRVDLEGVLIHMIDVRVMQVAVMQIVCMAGVADGQMAA
jgi:hypothetical protein